MTVNGRGRQRSNKAPNMLAQCHTIKMKKSSFFAMQPITLSAG